jgi:hypothetical protein
MEINKEKFVGGSSEHGLNEEFELVVAGATPDYEPSPN